VSLINLNKNATPFRYRSHAYGQNVSCEPSLKTSCLREARSVSTRKLALHYVRAEKLCALESGAEKKCV
jgi:hypothetical protein